MLTYHTIDAKIRTCKECGDRYTICRCRHDDCIKNDDGRCMECHLELFHKIVPDCADNIPRCGNEIGYPEDDAQYFPGICDRFYYV